MTEERRGNDEEGRGNDGEGAGMTKEMGGNEDLVGEGKQFLQGLWIPAYAGITGKGRGNDGGEARE